MPDGPPHCCYRLNHCRAAPRRRSSRRFAKPGARPAAAPLAIATAGQTDGAAAAPATDAISPLGNDQICYGKEAAGWKIIGFIGGAQ